jgi:hypothetical protein
MSDAAEIVALDVFEAAQAAGEPVTVALVKRSRGTCTEQRAVNEWTANTKQICSRLKALA